MIEVRHLNKGLKVGSLPRALATDLVPLMKDELIDLEGVAGDGASAISFHPGCQFRRLTRLLHDSTRAQGWTRLDSSHAQDLRTPELPARQTTRLCFS